MISGIQGAGGGNATEKPFEKTSVSVVGKSKRLSEKRGGARTYDAQDHPTRGASIPARINLVNKAIYTRRSCNRISCCPCRGRKLRATLWTHMCDAHSGWGSFLTFGNFPCSPSAGSAFALMASNRSKRAENTPVQQTYVRACGIVNTPTIKTEVIVLPVEYRDAPLGVSSVCADRPHTLASTKAAVQRLRASKVMSLERIWAFKGHEPQNGMVLQRL